jgi:ATP-dependent helicase YprA (DUF1998 family)
MPFSLPSGSAAGSHRWAECGRLDCQTNINERENQCSPITVGSIGKPRCLTNQSYINEIPTLAGLSARPISANVGRIDAHTDMPGKPSCLTDQSFINEKPIFEIGGHIGRLSCPTNHSCINDLRREQVAGLTARPISTNERTNAHQSLSAQLASLGA